MPAVLGAHIAPGVLGRCSRGRARYYTALELIATGLILVFVAAFAFGQTSSGGSDQTTGSSQRPLSPAEKRIEDVKSLIRSGNAQGAADLTARYDSESEPTVRAWLVRGAAVLDPAQSIPLFEAAMDDPSPWVRLAAVDCLGKLGNAPQERLLGQLSSEVFPRAPQESRSGVSDSRAPAGAQAVSDLETALFRESNAGVRQDVVSWLGILKKPGSAAALSDALSQDDDPNVRIQAAHSLKKVGTPEARKALKDAKSDPDDRVRRIADEK